MRTYIAVLAGFYSTLCFSQTEKQVNKGSACQTEWRYLTLSDTIQATVIFEATASVECGIVSVASTTLVKKPNGDTIRILQLCNTGAELKKGSRVRIVPDKIPSFRIDMVPYDPKACQIKVAYFGLIKQI